MKDNIRPAQPIDVPELLQGRESILRDIRRTLHSPGMHVFIHGERGIGKTSIALTAAKAYLKADPPWVGCDEKSTFEGIVGDICGALVEKTYLQKPRELSGTAGINVGLFKVEGKLGVPGQYIIPEKLTSVNHAANLVKEAAAARDPDEPIIVVDEIDRIENPEVKAKLAELIKAMHDMRVPLKMVMCGIGKTLDEIIGSHLSASRAITPFELAPISYDARWAIVTKAAAKLGFDVDRDFLIRISQISDGFPYYVHLIAENLFWEIFDHQHKSTAASSDDFHKAISRAIERAESPLREAYNYAIQKTTNSEDYEEALWAVAESTHLERQIKDIYERSYLPIIMECRQAKGRKALDVERFRTRLYRLCDQAHGGIIVRKRNSWYAFKENVLRGYVRLVAERNGVQLGADHF
ncbi:ATP-binding protein [Bradyrhizobium daqingense]|uniref:AAA family ATPase n=1 Tax=Bradyrhizobium daqingense TaxID=993502 RepID=UPI001315A9F9|nr:ATP-binding protein [Bradyrhizobium daqingense]UFS89525.1 ATP-binding protein [Bradyrhizobium daqingense]